MHLDWSTGQSVRALASLQLPHASRVACDQNSIACASPWSALMRREPDLANISRLLPADDICGMPRRLATPPATQDRDAWPLLVGYLHMCQSGVQAVISCMRALVLVPGAHCKPARSEGMLLCFLVWHPGSAEVSLWVVCRAPAFLRLLASDLVLSHVQVQSALLHRESVGLQAGTC